MPPPQNTPPATPTSELPTSEQQTLPLSAVPDGDLSGIAVSGIAVSGVAMKAASAAPRPIPLEFAGYRRLRPLGIGGMGEVHLAEHVRLKRQVALKLLRPNVSDDRAFSERFLRESKAMAAVSHPNVVAIHDSGEVDGFLFMAIEFVDGIDLGKLLKTRGTIDEATAFKIMIGCCKGLEAIYAAGLVHRDIKPANIFLDRTGEPKIGDLGLARHVDGEDRMTMTGNAWGTPAYMPPEQLRGIADIDIRSDLYALGATLFTILTGTEPFTGPTAFVVTTRILTEPSPDPRLHNRTLSPAVAAIIRACLEKDREKRYADPTALRVDLERARDHLPLAFAQLPAAIDISTAAEPTSLSARRAPVVAAPVAPQVNGTVITVLAYGTAAAVLALVIWSLQGGTSRPKTTVAGATADSPVGQSAPDKTLQSWIQNRGRDQFGDWARLVSGNASIRLRHLPGGTFHMGSPPDEPGRGASETLHQVTLTRPFWITDTEVSRDLWRAVMGGDAAGPAPITDISWHEAHDFLMTLNAQMNQQETRLPTEAEWEYACRAESLSAFPNGPRADSGEAIAGNAPRPVGSGQPNRYGLFDLPGNVSEWCLDNWNGSDPLSAEPEVDPDNRFGALSVVRGGAYSQPESAARSAARQAIDPQQRQPDLGFRFVIVDR